MEALIIIAVGLAGLGLIAWQIKRSVRNPSGGCGCSSCRDSCLACNTQKRVEKENK